MSQAPLLSGALLVRVWWEKDSTSLRARITVLKDLESSEQVVYVAAGIDDITARVRSCLQGFTDDLK